MKKMLHVAPGKQENEQGLWPLLYVEGMFPKDNCATNVTRDTKR